MAKRYGNKTKAKTAKVMRSLEHLCETPADVNTEVCCMSFLISLPFSLNAFYRFSLLMSNFSDSTGCLLYLPF